MCSFVPIFKALWIVPKGIGVWNFRYKIATLELFQTAPREEFNLWNRTLEHRSTGVRRAGFVSLLWSVPNHMGMNAVVDLLSSEAGVEAARKETATNRAIVAERADIFLREAQAIGLEIYPYKNGFFLTLPMADAFAVCEKLKEKNIFLAPIRNNALRVALCAIPTKKMPGLARAIQEAMEGIL